MRSPGSSLRVALFRIVDYVLAEDTDVNDFRAALAFAGEPKWSGANMAPRLDPRRSIATAPDFSNNDYEYNLNVKSEDNQHVLHELRLKPAGICFVHQSINQ